MSSNRLELEVHIHRRCDDYIYAVNNPSCHPSFPQLMVSPHILDQIAKWTAQHRSFLNASFICKVFDIQTQYRIYDGVTRAMLGARLQPMRRAEIVIAHDLVLYLSVF